MITVGVIRNGSTYLSRHLRKNDYWAEGEKELLGEWVGDGARALGLEGPVTAGPFEALRCNRHPVTEERLTAREQKQRVAFFDVQLSAPKDASVLAILGGDERVRGAFTQSVKVAVEEMERFAAVRERRGQAARTEAYRLTGNFIGALFIHDTSRDLDPQLHAHIVLANATWDHEREQWLALQPAEMLRASGYLRQVFYRELSGRLQELGYETHGMNPRGFEIRGLEHLRERFSKRARQVQKLADDFAEAKGRRPTKAEVEVIVRQSRADKLTEISTEEVRARQRQQLSSEEERALDVLVRDARKAGTRERRSIGLVRSVLEAAFRHVYETNSVVREGEVLNAALELYPDFTRWRELREALESHPESIRRNGQITLSKIRKEEQSTIDRVREGRNRRFSLGDVMYLPAGLTSRQAAAAETLLGNTDFLSVLVGDAGTGKTTVLTAIEQAHRRSGGKSFVPLAPTTRAREALVLAGFKDADTVQRFMVSDSAQAQARGRVLLIDEAGLLSTEQLDVLTRIAEDQGSRILLVGDIKQHYSVQRGDALRNVIRHTNTPVVRLSEVLRQRHEVDRQFSRLLASGRVPEAFDYADRRGLIEELGDDHVLFATAAAHYAGNVVRGIETLVVIPFWEEIDRFNVQAREELRRRGRLGEVEVHRDSIHPLPWSEEQKAHWDQYTIGDRLLFVRDTRFFKRGSMATVTEILPDGLNVAGDTRSGTIGRKQRGCFDVGRLQVLSLAAGDRLLIRGRDPQRQFSNGDFKDVASVDPATNTVKFTDGKTLPSEFKAWSYGHALTSYRSQGSTAEESLLVLGEVAERALMRRQFYVGNTRYRGAHRIYVTHREAILARLRNPDPGRELATEFMEQHGLKIGEAVTRHRLHRVTAKLHRAWLAMEQRWRQSQDAQRQAT